jgi:hypothetical protein
VVEAVTDVELCDVCGERVDVCGGCVEDDDDDDD